MYQGVSVVAVRPGSAVFPIGVAVIVNTASRFDRGGGTGLTRCARAAAENRGRTRGNRSGA